MSFRGKALVRSILFFDFQGSPAVPKVGLCISGLAPLGLLMGMPFPTGLRLCSIQWPSMTPWAWAVNGTTRVLGSVLGVMQAESQLKQQFNSSFCDLEGGNLHLLIRPSSTCSCCMPRSLENTEQEASRFFPTMPMCVRSLYIVALIVSASSLSFP